MTKNGKPSKRSGALSAIWLVVKVIIVSIVLVLGFLSIARYEDWMPFNHNAQTGDCISQESTNTDNKQKPQALDCEDPAAAYEVLSVGKSDDFTCHSVPGATLELQWKRGMGTTSYCLTQK